MERLDELLKGGHYKGASDIHIVAGSPPIYRINGQLLPQKKMDRILPEDTSEMAKAVLTDELWKTLDIKREVDLSYGITGVSRFRVNIFYQRSAISLAFRVIPREIPTIDELGLPRILEKVVQNPHGLFLVTGPTGSGKSTSLASMIDYMNRHMNKHIITLEDPIEYLHSHNQSIIEQREVGFDTLSFKDGLRASLRQDPDVILVGELRDLDTIQTAITAAETGHLVLGTLHTQDTTGTIDRMIDVFPVHQRSQTRTMLANVLIGVMSQRLFPTIDEESGRVAATELLINNSAIKNHIRSEKMHQIPNVLQTARDQGMHTMEMSIKNLIAEKRIRASELWPYSSQR
ncbi:twitching motility protein PilT [Alkalibacterium putridalgicola]|uniref:Twitching motility protein PilT n=1 Tax=Alkalibacterium putridalgicola TaxID=426703 RepID=A0A1H7T7M7_9LACT|nr:type IV pilus twitching motility protein PilT [Alkalibacterium putridalgicola]GEK89325.1 twitching motility protein PilT [Alkalibacterium putridalgicola]SEL80728.1 twitching motility protein PilT [Alkalibacterium putridalgicola]